MPKTKWDPTEDNDDDEIKLPPPGHAFWKAVDPTALTNGDDDGSSDTSSSDRETSAVSSSSSHVKSKKDRTLKAESGVAAQPKVPRVLLMRLFILTL